MDRCRSKQSRVSQTHPHLLTHAFSLTLSLSLTHTHNHARTHTLTLTHSVWVCALSFSRLSTRINADREAPGTQTVAEANGV